MNYAALNENYETINTIYFEEAPTDELITLIGYTKDKLIYIADNLPVVVGDEYRDGRFYRGGTLVEEQLMIEMPDEPEPDIVEQLRAQLAEAHQAISIIFGEADQ